MHATGYVSEFSSQITSTSPSAVPGIIISSYLKYLWGYEPDSWVAKVAYSARVVAILVSLPVAILSLLDIASYGIAQTLGVVDDVKAATSDRTTKRATETVPTIHINGESTPASESSYTDSEYESPTGRFLSHRQRKAQPNFLAVSQPKVFYASGDNSLKLAGADIFSPAASRPPSPTISRRPDYFQDGSGVEDVEKDKLGAGLRHRSSQADAGTDK